MTRFLLDTNVLLDVVLERVPFAVPARELWAAAERQETEILVPAHGVTTVFYMARMRGAAFARRAVADLLLVPKVATVDEAVLRRALTLEWPDFEDAVCAAAAEAARCDVLVTRDPKGYPRSPVLVLDPDSALSLIRPSGGPGQVAERPVRYAREKRRSHR